MKDFTEQLPEKISHPSLANMTNEELENKWQSIFSDCSNKYLAFVEAVNEEPISKLVNPDDLGEFCDHQTVNNPELFGQLLMEHLSDPMAINPDTFTESEKLWWMRVGVHMGPDFIAKFRKVGAWMEKTESFR